MQWRIQRGRAGSAPHCPSLGDGLYASLTVTLVNGKLLINYTVKHGTQILRIFKMIATSGFLTALECIEFVFGRGSAADFAGGA